MNKPNEREPQKPPQENPLPPPVPENDPAPKELPEIDPEPNEFPLEAPTDPDIGRKGDIKA